MSSAETRAVIEVLSEAMMMQQQHTPAPPQNNTALVEAFSQIQAILRNEDRGWEVISGGTPYTEEGLSLDDLKHWSPKIRESAVGAPWMGQGFRLRHSYVSENGIRYGNVPETGTKGKTNVKELIEDPLNQFHFFGQEARRKREMRLFADGIALYLGNDTTKKIESIPLRQITDQIVDPEDLGIIWAYKREWSVRNLVTGEVVPKKEWIFVDRFVDKRVPYVLESGNSRSGADRIPVSQTHRIFDMHANPMDGMPYGSPDALAAHIWLQVARGSTMDGVTMQKALASFAFKASVKTAGAGAAAAMALATPQGVGQTAVTGAVNDLTPLSNAGKGYDFGTLQFLVALVATSLSVPVIALMSDSSAAGSSYGSAMTLETPVRLAMEARRAEHVELDKRVLSWMTLKNPEVGWVPYAAGQETYRQAQAIMLPITSNSDLYSRQEVRDQLDDLFGRPNGKVPTDAQRPSVLSAKALAKAVPQEAPAGSDDGEGGANSVGSPLQGRSNATGGAGNGTASNDLRADGVGD